MTNCRSTLCGKSSDGLTREWGSCLLKRHDIARKVCEALHFFDGDRYELGAYVVMPNHVHLLVRTLQPKEHPLETILQSRKRHTAQSINRYLSRAGTLWQEESFDRIVRDEEHLWRCIQYIGRNPKLANLPREDCPRWVPTTWEKLGWAFEDV